MRHRHMLHRRMRLQRSTRPRHSILRAEARSSIPVARVRIAVQVGLQVADLGRQVRAVPDKLAAREPGPGRPVEIAVDRRAEIVQGKQVEIARDRPVEIDQARRAEIGPGNQVDKRLEIAAARRAATGVVRVNRREVEMLR
jgi:hypothetical protein